MGKLIPKQMTLEMGLTLDEFVRTLPSAVAPCTFTRDERHFVIIHPQGQIDIQLHPTAQRRIASLSLPATPVEFIFCGLDDDQRSSFMARFARYFQRGGG